MACPLRVRDPRDPRHPVRVRHANILRRTSTSSQQAGLGSRLNAHMGSCCTGDAPDAGRATWEVPILPVTLLKVAFPMLTLRRPHVAFVSDNVRWVVASYGDPLRLQAAEIAVWGPSPVSIGLASGTEGATVLEVLLVGGAGSSTDEGAAVARFGVNAS